MQMMIMIFAVGVVIGFIVSPSFFPSSPSSVPLTLLKNTTSLLIICRLTQISVSSGLPARVANVQCKPLEMGNETR